MKLVDIHTHRFEKTVNQIRIINLFPENEDLMEEGNYYSMGIHPWHIKNPEEELFRLEDNLKNHKNILAVGEAGIDKKRGPDLETQTKIFLAQTELSESYHRPVIIHSVKSFPEILHLYKKHRPKMPWIIHGFSGNETTGRQLINAGFYLSVGEALLRKEKLQRAVSTFPSGRIFLETDESPVEIEILYRLLASFTRQTVEEVILQKEKLFHQVFQP